MKINKQTGISALTLLLLIVLGFAASYLYTTKLSEPSVQEPTSNTPSAASINSDTGLDFDWPPKIDQPFPDIELVSHTGELLKLSDLKGQVILVEPMGMTCAACNAFSGAKEKGGYQGISYQQNLPPIESLLPQYAHGTNLEDEGLVLVQVLLYDMQYKAPTAEDARIWAEHFGLDNKSNVYILAGDERYINKASYDMIPGFFLVDKDFILRSDSTGHRPKHNLYTHLLPKIPELLAAESLSQIDDRQFSEKLYQTFNQSMAVEEAYQSIPHKQTTFNPASAKMSPLETDYLDKLFSIVDLAVVERVQTLLWYQTEGRRGENNGNYKQIIAELVQMDIPENLEHAHTLVTQAISEQDQYFRKIDSTNQYTFNADDHKIRSSHAKLIQAYSLLMALFPQENKHNKQAFFDHLCALDFV